MTQFLGDIAGMLELFAIAAGLLLLHRAKQVPSSGFVRAAGLVLLIGGMVVGACTTWYWLKYQSAGEFDRGHGATHHEHAMPEHGSHGHAASHAGGS